MADFELTPQTIEEGTQAVQQAVADDISAVAEEAAKIDVTPILDVDSAIQEEPKKEENPLAKYTADEQRQITAVADKIDITDSNAVLSYGASAQRKVSDFADGALASVRGKDMGETGQVLSSLLVELQHNGEPKKGIFGGLFDNADKQFDRLKAQYSTTEANIDRLIKLLEEHEQQLVKDIVQLDKLYDKNKLYFKEVSMYIDAGKLALEKARTETLPELQKKAAETNSPEDAQAAQDYADMITRFEKKLYDLELSRTVCLQSAPEIRMVQNSDTIMSEKIHSTIINVIPMWKTQMVLALNNYHTQKAIDAQNAVTEATNEMLRKNAEALHMSSVETAKASERGIVDIETLQHTNQQLISALDEIQQIQADGKVARANAEKELNRIEEELKQKMLKVASTAGKSAEQLAAEMQADSAK
ncbi:MAG: toxic anion resistance protein [Mogibacterium sp.]|nr:toxic anion resistance protein [Mogibacterium sp.]